MEAAAALAGQAGCYKIQLISRADRQAAHSLYEAHGFRAVATGYRRYLS